MSEIQADGADHSEGEVNVEMEANLPEWYLENYEVFKSFLAMSEEERSALVGEASGIFGTVLASLTPAGEKALVQSGNSFAAANFQSFGDKYKEMGATDFILLLLGAAVECLGIQQLKIQQAREQ